MLAGLSCSLCLAFAGFARAAPTELVLLNWDEYLDPELVQEFEQQHDARIKQVYYGSDTTRDNMMIESDGKGYDLVVLNDNAMRAYRRRGWLAPVSEAAIPNLAHIDRRWIDAVETADGYGVPYFWGTVGIVYRADLVPEPMTSWKQLFEPHPTLHGKIGMIADPPDLVGMALKSLGHSVNSQDSAALEAVEQLLMKQKPHVRAYELVDLSEDSALVSGEIVAAMLYNGDAAVVAEHHPKIAFAVPQEGGNLWVDYIAVTASCEKKQLANAFINFLNDPENAARLAQFVHYATPNLAAEKLLPEEFLNDPIIYPSQEVLRKSEFYKLLPPRVEKRRNNIFARVVYAK